ncbi:MAG: bifunctional diguanylate cyclase/phosphodiesterase, partial [Sulfurimonas sp.]|nr:bifunctional diguanylate cyclase/phosphodiesterase [Sulfurimonas sp.]
MVKSKDLVIFSLLFVLGISFAYIYNEIKTTKEDIFTRVERDQIEHISGILQNIESDFISSLGIKNKDDMLEKLENNENRKKYEHIASLLMTPNIKYAYIL